MANTVTKTATAFFLVLYMAYAVYSQSINCTATGAGRFADSSDTTCKTYTYCVELSNGTYLSYNYECPSTSIFDPDTSLCSASTSYVCNGTTSD